MKTVKIGDTVNWKGCFGMDAPRAAKVVSMELTDYPRAKYGKVVNEVTAEQIAENRVLFTLDNNHWCYSEQIEIIDQQKDTIKKVTKDNLSELANVLMNYQMQIPTKYGLKRKEGIIDMIKSYVKNFMTTEDIAKYF